MQRVCCSSETEADLRQHSIHSGLVRIEKRVCKAQTENALVCRVNLEDRWVCHNQITGMAQSVRVIHSTAAVVHASLKRLFCPMSMCPGC
jgi:hypothetical protein